MQDQENYIEVWIEKATLEGLAIELTNTYCIRLLTSRGFNSISKLKEYSDRAKAAVRKGQHPVVLYLGDHDPSGLNMQDVARDKIREYGVAVEFKRIALTYNQAKEWNLPKNPDSVKVTDTRSKGYVKQFGDFTWEIEAIHPSKIQDLIKQSIINEIDAEVYNMQIDKETEERNELKRLDARVQDLLRREFPQFA
jgi:hypothetical protein